MTDVVFGNMHKMTSVLVDPLTYKRDHPAALVIRFFEVHILLPIIRFVLGLAQTGSSSSGKRDRDDKMK
jgi:predicted HAD superfamily phosphohydrolase YqeG